jgi:glycosyltransferase involved in cell wall biosynthesis
LQVIPALGSGGVEIETLEMAKAIVSAGGRALIAANLKGNENLLSEIPSEIEFINLPLDTKNPFQIAKNTKLLKKLIQHEKVTILHARSRAPAWSAYKATCSLGIPFITTYHAAYASQTVFKTFYNSVMARGDRVIAISNFIQDHLIKKYQSHSWFDPSKVRLIQRGIDLHYFDPSAISHERLNHLRESWEIPPHMRLILLPGRLSRSKGHRVLIQALSLMQQTNVMAIFVGSAQKHEVYLEQLLKEASSLDLEGRVKWFPPCPDIPAAYQLADIITCPSLVPEGFGRLMAESQAMKKPIIASDSGAASEVIDPGITGWLVPPGDPAALAEALDRALLLSHDRLEAMGIIGRQRVQSYFSKEHMASKTIDVYKEFLEK